jgi:hypothetical protein
MKDNLDHELHNITASRSADHASSDVDLVFVKRADVSGIVEVIVHLEIRKSEEHVTVLLRGRCEHQR